MEVGGANGGRGQNQVYCPGAGGPAPQAVLAGGDRAQARAQGWGGASGCGGAAARGGGACGSGGGGSGAVGFLPLLCPWPAASSCRCGGWFVSPPPHTASTPAPISVFLFSPIL